MGIKRQVGRQRLAVQRKRVKRATKEIKSLMRVMPAGCHLCGAEFTPRETPVQMDTWKIVATRTYAELTCDACTGDSNEQPAV